MAAINAAKASFPNAKIVLCYWHYPRNLKDYARSKKCSQHLADDRNFQRWLRKLIGASFLPLEWMEEAVDHLLANPPRLHRLLQPHMDTFIDYYRKQWRDKLKYINYYDTIGPRTTNGNECYHSSLNTVIPEKKLDFRICFTRYKQSLADGADDYLRSQYGEILKRRKPKYVESERKIIQRKAEMNVLYDAFVENNNNRPEMDVLLLYSYKQAKSSTQRFDDTQPDPRFVLQDAAAAVPNPQLVQQPIIQQPNLQPQQQPIVNQPNVFIHPFFGQQQLMDFAGMRQMLHQPIRPQFYQRFAPPQMYQQPPRVNLNQSLPVNYNHQFIMQQFPPNQFYRF